MHFVLSVYVYVHDHVDVVVVVVVDVDGFLFVANENKFTVNDKLLTMSRIRYPSFIAYRRIHALCTWRFAHLRPYFLRLRAIVSHFAGSSSPERREGDGICKSPGGIWPAAAGIASIAEVP